MVKLSQKFRVWKTYAFKKSHACYYNYVGMWIESSGIQMDMVCFIDKS